MTDKPPKQRPRLRHHRARVWRRWLRRAVRHSLWVLLLVGIGLAAFVYYVPFSSAPLNRRIARSFEEQTGLRVEFDSGRLYAAQRLYALRNVRVYVPGSPDPEPALVVQSINAHVYALRLFTGRSTFLESVDLDNPAGLHLVYNGRGIAPGPRTREMVETVQAHSSPDKAGALPFRTLRLNNAAVTLSESVSTGSLESFLNVPVGTASGFLIYELDAVFTSGNRSDKPNQLKFNGRISSAEGLESNLDGTATHQPGKSIAVSLNLADMVLPNPFGDDATGSFSAAKLTLEGSLGIASGNHPATAIVTAENLSVALPAQAIHLNDRNVRVELAGAHNSDTRRLTIDRLSLQGEAIDAEAEGFVETTAPNTFEGHVVARRVGEPYYRLLARYLPPRWAIAARDTSILVDASAQGDRTGLASIIGKIRLNDISLAIRDLDKPVSGLQGEIVFETARVLFQNFRGEYGRSRVELDGSISGDFLSAREGNLTLNWQATALPDDVISIFRFANPNNPDLPGTPRRSAGTGAVTTTGTLEQFVSLSQPERTSLPSIHAEVDIANVDLTHPLLPSSVRGLVGSARVRDNRILIDNLRGTSNKSDFTMNGVMQGKGTFWRDPYLTASLAMNFSLDDAIAYLPKENREQLAEIKPTGEATINLDLSTPLPSKNEATARGNITFRKVGFIPRLDFMNAEATDLNGRLTWTGNSVRLEKCEGLINGEKLSASGRLARDEIQLDLSGKIQLQTLAMTFPKATQWLELSGPASGNVSLRVADGGAVGSSSNSSSQVSLADLLTSLAPRLNIAVAENRYSLEGTFTLGDAQTGASFRHKAMPPGRRGVAQADITAIRGDINVKNHSFTVPAAAPLTGNFADTRNCRAYGEMEFRKGSFPRLKFTLNCNNTAFFDPWILGWGSAPRPPDAPVPAPGPPGKSFDLDGRIIANAGASYHGRKFDRANIELDYSLTQGRPRITNIRKVEATGLGGKVVGSAKLESSPWLSKNESLRWIVNAEVENLTVRDLRRLVFNEESRIDGAISTNLRLSGVSNVPGSMRGQGRATLSDINIGRTPMALSLFQVPGIVQGTQRNMQNSRFSSIAPVRYTIGDGALSVRELQLATQGLIMGVSGRYIFGDQLDFVIQMKILQSSLLGDIPILDQAAKLVDTVAGQLLSFRVRGTTDRPIVEPAPLTGFQ